jgi:Uma2 family endonuclease
MEPTMTFQTILPVEYPETDGRPMGETDLHIEWMIRVRDMLKYRYRDQQVYVAANLLLYFQEGDPSRFVVPDTMVVKDCQPGRRRTFKIWEEGRSPNAVFEITSRGTKSEDLHFKPQIYAQIGVVEHFLYDPTAEYLRPPLQGRRLTATGFEPIAPDAAGRVLSSELGLWLHLEDGDLVLTDAVTGERLPTAAEAHHAVAEAYRAEAKAQRAKAKAERAKAEAQRAEADAQRIEAESQRAAAEAQREAREKAEAEVQELREKLRRHGLAD